MDAITSSIEHRKASDAKLDAMLGLPAQAVVASL